MTRLLLVLCLVLCASCATAVDKPPARQAASAVQQTPPPAKPAVPLGGTSTLAKVEAAKLLRVGVAINAPWVMHDKNGELFGYSIDLARKIGEDMGWRVEIVTTSWPRLLYDLRTNQFDVVASGLSIAPQRALLAHFSQPFGEYDIAVVVNRARYPKGGTRELAAAKGRRIAAHRGTLTVDIARSRLPQAEIVEVDDEEQAIEDLRAGKFDGYAAEAPTPLLLEKIYPKELRALVADPLARTAHGLAVRLDDRDLLDVLNAWIVDRQASGWLNERESYWFETTGWASQL
ncbi:MAG TPA: transporter substrate-binding domain-containing protein [Dokdonella sp.]